MSRENYRRQSNGPQEAYSTGDPLEGLFTGYAQPYLYPDNSFEYYGVPYIPNVQTSESYWYNDGLGYDYNTIVATASIIEPPFSTSQSVFSADAPEFVSKHSFPIAKETAVDNEVQQPCGKKKKNKKKATNTSLAFSNSKLDEGEEKTSKSQTSPSKQKACNPGILNHSSRLRLPESAIGDKVFLPVKPLQMSRKNQPVNEKKSVRFQETSAEDVEHLEIKKPEILNKNRPGKEANSVRFRKSLEDEKEGKAISRSKISCNVESSEKVFLGSWPKPPLNVTQSQGLSKRPPKMSFADKLKSPAPMKSPYLDWRDQRTHAINAPIEPNPNIMVCRDEKVRNQKVTLTKADEASNNDGFQTVARKKPKDKKPEKTTEEMIKLLTSDKVGASVESNAKKKSEKERKKSREKQKKKQAREEKLLAEKLAPKGQKVTIITPKLMQQYLQSSRRVVGTGKPVMKLNEDMFPALGKRTGVKCNVSESESDWETTEIECVQKEPVMTQRNVKRSDPIEFDLMALITKKNTKKKTTSDILKKSKSRPGLVANVLDRSAPTLSRGKIRNKKRKLSEIRKALLLAKAKKKLAHELEVPAIQPNATRPHLLHSKKFREYCDQMLTDEIDLLARDMLYHLRMFQDRVYKKDPIKARMKKRLVAGLREVTKQVERNRIKIIFLAPDIQRCPETGGLDEAVRRLLDAARRLDLPIVYALSRRKLGRVLFKKVPVSCCGILNFQATEETWKQLTKAVTVARENYQKKLQELCFAVDGTEKKTNVDDSSMNIAALAVEKKPDQTDTLLELMKLSLKN